MAKSQRDDRDRLRKRNARQKWAEARENEGRTQREKGTESQREGVGCGGKNTKDTQKGGRQRPRERRRTTQSKQKKSGSPLLPSPETPFPSLFA